MPQTTKIIMPKLLLVEGMDAKMFCIWAVEAWGKPDIQVIDFGGVTDFSAFIKTLPAYPGYDSVNAIAIARDAEKDGNSAVDSIKYALQAAGFAVPDQPFSFAGGSPKVAYMVFPGYDIGGQILPGTLEDLCMMTVAPDPILSCVDAYVQCIQNAGEAVPRPHKTKLYAYLAGKDKFVDKKLGEAAKAKAWDWNHAALASYKSVIEQM